MPGSNGALPWNRNDARAEADRVRRPAGEVSFPVIRENVDDPPGLIRLKVKEFVPLDRRSGMQPVYSEPSNGPLPPYMAEYP